MHEFPPPYRVAPNPAFELLPDERLFLRRQRRFLRVQDALRLPVRSFHDVINADVAQIQRVLQYLVRVGAFRSVCCVGGDISFADRAFLRDMPFGGDGRKLHPNMLFQIPRRVERLVHKPLENLFVNPRTAQPDFDFRGVEVFRLDFFQRFDVGLKFREARRRRPRLPEFGADVAGKVFVRRLPAMFPAQTALRVVERPAVGVFVNYAAQTLHDFRDFFGTAHEGRHKLQINAGFLSDGHDQRIRNRVDTGHAPPLLDGSFCEEIRLALQLSVLVQNFQ